MTRRPFLSPTLLTLSSLSLLPSAALAQAPETCASDADCPTGGICQKDQWVDGCAPSPDGDTSGCDTSVHEAEFGTCYVPPPECNDDAACDEYLSCQSSGSSGVCSSDAGGEVKCETPTEDPPKYCGPAGGVECEADSDCPREFECINLPESCTDIACPEEKPDCNTCFPGGTTCQPKHIECDSDAQCPSDWSCLGNVTYTCSGGGEAGDPVGGPTPGDSAGSDSEPEGEPAAAGGAAAIDEPTPDVRMPDDPTLECQEVPTTGSCSPTVWQDFGRAESGGDISTSDPETPTSGEGAKDDVADPANGGEEPPADTDLVPGMGAEEATSGGGCSTAPSTPGSMANWLLLLGGLVPLIRRRRAA